MLQKQHISGLIYGIISFKYDCLIVECLSTKSDIWAAGLMIKAKPMTDYKNKKT